MSGEAEVSGLRTDARRNRKRLVAVAREVFVAEGADARLEVIARRAGVGIATLYRHFPDRESLIRQVITDNTGEQLAVATAAVDEEHTAWDALVRYTTEVVDRRLGLLKPVLGGRFHPDERFREIQLPLLAILEGLVSQAQLDGDLRADIALGDIQLLITLISRPIPTASRQLADHMARRYLQFVLQGLRRTDGPALPAPPIRTIEDDRLPTENPPSRQHRDSGD